jgi:diguanylate cyclase (GGDEF)-like protein
VATAPDRDYPPRLRLLIATVYAVSIPLFAGAVASIVLDSPDSEVLVGASVFAVLAFLADLRPVPLDETGSRSVSLAFVFVLASQILFGWEYAVVTGALSVSISQLVEGREIRRTIFNGGVYALAAAASFLPSTTMASVVGTEALGVTVSAFAGGAAFVFVNVSLVCLAVSLFHGTSYRELLDDNMRHAGPAFLTMGFLAALAVVLYQESPVLLVLLAGPLATLTLYQRSSLATKIATRAAHTDSLTGLGNHRAYELDLAASLERVATDGEQITLCYVDVDVFKEVNDVHGHPVGDAVLEELASMLGGQSEDLRAFRLGGDEFAIVFDRSAEDALAHMEQVREAVSEMSFPSVGSISISVGLGSSPSHANDPEELERVVDAALYWAKIHGKNRSCLFNPGVVPLLSAEAQQRAALRQTRLKAAESLIRVVDAKDTYTGQHSASVSSLSASLAVQLGLDAETVEQVRMAGLLHDLGKILLADDVLSKPAALCGDELALVRTHPELGYSLLVDLDIAPVDTWVRHHHEHWDGSGYPHGLRGEDIPLGSRIILVADAYDAMTSDRSYRQAVPPNQALGELRALAGKQFDPQVVDALVAELGLDVLSRAEQPFPVSELLVA